MSNLWLEDKVATDATAIRVKIADLHDNLRNNKALERTPEVDDRIHRYQAALLVRGHGKLPIHGHEIPH
jgi:hypothetical protein